MTTGSFNGQYGAFLINLATGVADDRRFTRLRADRQQHRAAAGVGEPLGLTAADGSFEYKAVSFSLEGPGQDPMNGKAGFNPWTPALTNFPFYGVPANGTGSDSVAIDPVAFEQQKPLGVMLVDRRQCDGAAEAQLLKAPGNP